MPRLRGPLAAVPEGASAWPSLNALLFGAHDRGGYDTPVLAEATPVDWPAVFGRTAPMALEIGFNRGYFLTELARRNPQRDHVGIEVARRFVWRYVQLMATRPGGPPAAEGRTGPTEAPPNVRVAWADARAAAPAMFAPASLEAIYILFPDPWWKKRHHKRRLVQGDFGPQLAALLAPGGRIWIKSDVPDIAGEIDEALAAQSDLGDRREFEVGDLPLTWRERKCIATGLPITRFSYGKLG